MNELNMGLDSIVSGTFAKACKNAALLRSAELKKLTAKDLSALSRQAQHSPRLRANSNLHQDLSDSIQRLANAMEPDTLIPPHRHAQTWELMTTLRGRFTVLLFDDAGKVTERAELGTDVSVLEVPINTWHAVLSRDSGAVLFEVKHGPYTPIAETDIAAWSNGRSAAELNAWYAVARLGDKFPS